MRLHRLALTAFGPFAGTEHVDFDRLTSAGLFLLRGNTGAGKTSVLDAVCFALYGEVPGARKGNLLRSDHADPGHLTEVCLELTLAGRRLEITRRPEQQRPKRRGSGTTTEKAQTLLREWVADARDGRPGWRASSSSHQEVGEELRRLIGMSREQFCQVVLLPQGDFARFLRADAAQRAELLGRLFDTRRFEQVESWLAEHRRRRNAEVQEGLLRLRDLAGRAEQAAGPRAEPMAAWQPPGEEGDLAGGVLAWAAIVRSEAAEQLAVARSALAPAEAAHESARRHQEGAGELADRQRRHRVAEQQMARLAARAPDLAEDERLLAAAQAAAAVEPVLRLRDAAQAALQATRSAERGRRAELAARCGPAAPGHPRPIPPDRGGSEGRPDHRETDQTDQTDPGETTVPRTKGPVPGTGGRFGGSRPPGVPRQGLAVAGAQELAETERRLRAQLGELRAATADERRHAELGREEERLADRQRQAEDAAEQAQDWLREFDGRLRELRQRQEAARSVQAEVERLDARRTELVAQVAAAERRERLQAEIASAERELLARQARLLDARQHGLDLRERRLAGMSAELAGQLRADEPCRVCGSQVHPAPARPAGSRVTAEDEALARAEQQRAEQAAGEVESELTALKVAAAAAAATAGGREAAELRAELAGVETSRRPALAAADGLDRLERLLTELAEKQTEQQDGLRQAGELGAALSAARQAMAAERAELGRRLTEARGDAPSVAAKAASLEALAEAIAAALATVQASTAAGERSAAAERELSQAVRAAGFDTPEAVRQAMLPDGLRAESQARVERHRAEVEATRRQLTDPELVAAATLPPVDLAAARAGYQTATVRLRTASAAEAAAGERCAELARIGARIRSLAAELAPALEEHDRISRLVDLVSGHPRENALRMRLESYVLAARLEQVAAAASERLLRMSGGRYTLVHSDDRVRGNARSGLSLRVVDAWTGVARDTATLSGGESFFASLALALGLADVVTDEIGGMPLDTLFIDEGFGSLDEHTLEEVMDVLDSLRERDRAVGIVSHVADLRSRIPAQLLVEKGRHGSTLRLASREAG